MRQQPWLDTRGPHDIFVGTAGVSVNTLQGRGMSRTVHGVTFAQPQTVATVHNTRRAHTGPKRQPRRQVPTGDRRSAPRYQDPWSPFVWFLIAAAILASFVVVAAASRHLLQGVVDLGDYLGWTAR
jgi:hypothetical protein